MVAALRQVRSLTLSNGFNCTNLTCSGLLAIFFCRGPGFERRQRYKKMSTAIIPFPENVIVLKARIRVCL